MQFALIDVSEQSLLVSAVEFRALQEQWDLDDEHPGSEADMTWRLAYGALKVQPGVAPEAAAADIRRLCGTAFGRIDPISKVCRLSLLQDIEFLPMVQYGRTVHFPIAALLRTTEEIPQASEHALALYPRFGRQMDALTNVLNRPAILALKGEEIGARDRINPDPSGVDWRSLVDRERAHSCAGRCR